MAKPPPLDLDALKAAYAAKGGTVTPVKPGVAYGVDTEADKRKAKEARAKARHEARMADMAELYEREAEQHRERVNDAYMTGGRSAAMRALNGED